MEHQVAEIYVEQLQDCNGLWCFFFEIIFSFFSPYVAFLELSESLSPFLCKQSCSKEEPHMFLRSRYNNSCA